MELSNYPEAEVFKNLQMQHLVTWQKMEGGESVKNSEMQHLATWQKVEGGETLGSGEED